MRLLYSTVLVYFVAECTYKICWYVSGGTQIPHYGNIYLSSTIACILEVSSWIYRTSLFFFVCILYKLICFLQILRLEGFAQVFQQETEVGSILIEHLSIRRNLRIISHRFRAFMLLSLLMVTASQFAALLMTTRASSQVNIFKAGELAVSVPFRLHYFNMRQICLLIFLLMLQLCSVTLITGLVICLRSATKVTHKAQSITGLAAKWHVCATINSLDYADNETPPAQISSAQVFPLVEECESDDEGGDEDDNLDDAKLVPIYAHTISYQKRQALG